MSVLKSTTHLRVRYSETDQMGTFYNSRSLEWFECGRTDWLRQAGVPYAQLESRGLYLPLVEAHVYYQGRARYDDELVAYTLAGPAGRAKLRFDITIHHAGSGLAVTSGTTIHALTDPAGKPIRPPEWFTKTLADKVSRFDESP